MDWLLATPQIHSAFSSLGSLHGDAYVVSPNALSVLEEINYKLTYEDQTLRTFRRAIGFGQNVRSDLIPLLENAKDDDVLDSVIRILVNLTVPVECLFSVDIMHRTEVGRHTIYELNQLLYTSKEAFSAPKSTKSVVDYMKHILESDSKLSPQKCDRINNCLLLLRNILHIPEIQTSFIISTMQSSSAHSTPMQNAILWNLFIQNIDKLLIYLMTCPQRAFWGVTMVQLIALMYKDQHVSALQKLLNMWFEASLSESSEDNESNTSPPKQGSGDSSPMLTSDPTSDSSDNGKSTNSNHEDRKPYFRLGNALSSLAGSSGSKNASCEIRLKALQEETKATLEEVSRKGQKYQNSLIRVQPEVKVDTIEVNDCEKQFTSTQAVVALAVTALAQASSPSGFIGLGKILMRVDAMESLDDEEGAASDVTVIDLNTKNKIIQNGNENDINYNDNDYVKNISNQPAQHSTHTTNHDMDEKTTTKFKPPPAKPLKSTAGAQLIKTGSLSDEVDTELPDSLPKSCQKVPHGGQLNLTKGKCCPQKRECPSSQSELSDCGYGTQVENQESVSTSSNDDDAPHGKPQHQKPPCCTKQRNKQRTGVDKKELRRKKLVRRGKNSLINMKGLVQHTPTDEDISNLLKEFTVDFLLKGYGHLVEDLHSQLLTNMKIPIDTSHFFWLVTYFLKFSAQLELEMEHIKSILTYDVISYLTYEGVSLCEQLELNSRQEGSDLKPYLRRMHLVVTAIREFLQAIETYKKVTHLSEDERARLQNLQIQISTTEDLRCLFVLLIRRFNPSLHTKQYLQDLVVTNHILLLVLDSVNSLDCNVNVKMTDHISQFATLEIMHYYGMLLEDFDNNGEFINDCLFTMMHHIGGDLEQVATLFQPVILKTYSRIWEADYELCDDWSDLIEYVIHKFMNTPQKSPLPIPTTSLTELTKEHNHENTGCSWTQEEMNTLYWYYVQSKKHNDVVGKIVKLFINNGNKGKSRISIVQQLLQQDIITLVEYDDLMKFEDAEYQRTLLTTPTSSTTESGIEIKDSSSFEKQPSDDIQILRDLIIKEQKGMHLVWLQKLLLECCYIKLVLKSSALREDHQDLKFVMEPVAYHCIMKNKSIPVVQWNSDQAATMLYQPFVLLLHKLGFQLPADAGSVFARIPSFWTADMMYNLAKKLGPIDKLSIKFTVDHLNDSQEEVLKVNLARCFQASAPPCSNSAVLSLGDEISFPIEVPLLRNHSGHFSNSTLTPVPEVPERANDIFAVPKAKHCNAIIRFTPDPMSSPCSPNWLQLVMSSKNSSTPNANTIGSTATSTTAVTISTISSTSQILYDCNSGSSVISAIDSKNISSLITNSTGLSKDANDDGKKSLERNDSFSSGFCTRSGSGNLDSEYSAIIASVYENEIANSDNASVASDLTRMYVSDEEEKHEFRVEHFH